MHDLKLEQLRLNELSDEEARQAQLLITTNPTVAARVRAIQASDMAIAEGGLIQVLTAGVVARVQVDRRERARRSTWTSLLLWGVPAFSVMVLAVVVYPLIRPQGNGDAHGERPKGAETTLAIYRETPTGSERLSDKDVAREGDVIRLGYRTNQPYGAILSVDGRRMVTRHLPADGASAQRLNASALVLLDHAYELDDAPIVERFYLITSSAPFAIEPIASKLADAAEGTAAQPLLPSPLHVVTFSLRKESKP